MTEIEDESSDPLPHEKPPLHSILLEDSITTPNLSRTNKLKQSYLNRSFGKLNNTAEIRTSVAKKNRAKQILKFNEMREGTKSVQGSPFKLICGQPS